MAALGAGCSRAKETSRTVPSGSVTAPLASRAEVVTQADQLAVRGTNKPGAEGAHLLMEAARLRQRVFRLEGAPQDALEATALLRAASTKFPGGSCDAEIDLALLEGETNTDLASEYLAVYSARARHPGETCALRAGEILSTLASFEPPANVLAAIDERKGRTKGVAAVASTRAPAVTLPTVVESTSKEPARITSVERYGGRDASRVVVMMTRPATYEVGELAPDASHGPRLFVDVHRARYRGPASAVGAGIVDKVRIAEKESGVRLVLDLNTPASHRLFYLPEPFRLVIDVMKQAASVHSDMGASPRHVRRVVLDPGHGGTDPGARGAGGLREKDVVLDIAHRAAPLIARELGISTLLTRDSDTFVPLDERVAKANGFSADLFVSIHCNAAESASGRGIMTFVLDASRDDVALRVAARENAASTEAAIELGNAMSRTVDSESLGRSSQLASLLQRSAVASLSPQYSDIQDHGVKSAGFYVLAGARMPAVLFETSFISNPSEERWLDTADYRQKLADSIVNAVRAFRDGL